MEKFAVDLDKVLDDFELNEDENESSSHYDKLQLEFRRENVGVGGISGIQMPPGLGAVGGWSEVVHEPPPVGARGPPDGQHDDNEGPPICTRQLDVDSDKLASCFSSESFLPTSSERFHPTSSEMFLSTSMPQANNDKDLLNEEKQFAHMGRPDITSSESSTFQELWPNLSNRNITFSENIDVASPPEALAFNLPLHVHRSQNDLLVHSSLSSTSTSNPEVSIASASVRDAALLHCPLDVLPLDVPSDVGNLLFSHEGQHPDILDMKQNSPDEHMGYPECLLSREARENSYPERTINESPEIVPIDDLTAGHHRDSLLLPDLMPTNNVDRLGISLDLPEILPETSNPAIVTENSLNFNHNDPAIVQESQSNSRIPEVVNIHQSIEHFGSSGQLNDNTLSSYADNLSSSASSSLRFSCSRDTSSRACNIVEGEVESASEGRLCERISSLPDISAGCESLNLAPELEAEHSSLDQNNVSNETPIVCFNPCACVNEDELDTELQALEEEQMHLEEVYNNSGLPLHPPAYQEDYGNESSQILEAGGACKVSQSPDLIGSIDSMADKQAEDYIEDTFNQEEISEFVLEPAVHEELKTGDCNNRCSVTKEESRSEKDDYSNHPPDNAEAIDSLNDSGDPDYCSKPESQNRDDADDVSSESTGTDTVSSSSTLTEGESSLSPDHQLLPATDQPSPSASLPDSPSRETPGTLVTAVYDDDSGSGLEDEGSASRGAEGFSDGSGISGVGLVAPFWIPDEEAPNCQECGVKFTVLRRRHHCRACGRVLCAPCCHYKAPLPYMEFKEARVCGTCLHLLTEASEREDEEAEGRHSGRTPNPNNPMEYCSRIPPQQQVVGSGSGPPPTVMVPVGVLKRETSNAGNNSSSSRPRGNKQVIFSDGIRPGGDLTELGGQTRPSSPFRKTGRNTRRVFQNLVGSSSVGDGSCGARGTGTNGGLPSLRSLAPDTCLIPSDGGLPPVLLKASSTGEYVFDANPDCNQLEEQMKGDGPPVVFALQKNLTVLVKLVKLDCCVGLEVWNVATRGLCNVGQEELVVLLEVIPGEKSPPPHLFAFFHTVYQQANKGNLVTELGHTIFTEPEGFLGSKDHGGFLYIRPTFQCLQKFVLPPAPYIFAVLIQKWETPWAKVFPLRLMLRLGAEYRYYPCPLVSTRNRKPVYCEIGHTIMNLLVDFRNYAYTVPVVQGFVIHMEDKKTSLLLPRNRYEQVLKALNNSNDHVLALGANFSPQADSHLVTVEDDDGHYSTQAINIHNKPRRVTGASFIVFNGALKSNSGLKAKSSIVEDGLMVQIPGEMMVNLRDALRNMKDFDIPCGPSSSSEPDELVLIRWGQDDKNFNVGIKSPVDDRQMDGVPSVKIHSGTDYISSDHLIRWTEVFIIQGETTNSNNDVNISRLSESLARACCVALTPHLALLYGTGPNRLALRATIHQENVGYEAGMGGSRLLPTCMNELDTELIPVIHRAAANITDQPIILELLFHIMEQ